jgi:hypothetical protein
MLLPLNIGGQKMEARTSAPPLTRFNQQAIALRVTPV